MSTPSETKKKTIIFTTENATSGDGVIVGKTGDNGNAIKVLKAMKKIQNKDDYEVDADDKSQNFLQVAQKLGYKAKQKEPKIDLNKVREELQAEYALKLQEASGRLTAEMKKELEASQGVFNEEMSRMRETTLKKQEELDGELGNLREIKRLLKKQIYN